MAAAVAVRLSCVTNASVDWANSCKSASRSSHSTMGMASTCTARRNLALTLARAGCKVTDYCTRSNQVRGFLAMADPTNPLGGRQSPRTSMDIPVWLVVETEGERPAYSARILNASEWGARVATHAKLVSNQTIELFPKRLATFGVPGRVVWKAEIGPARENEAGVNFFEQSSVDFWTE